MTEKIKEALKFFDEQLLISYKQTIKDLDCLSSNQKNTYKIWSWKKY